MFEALSFARNDSQANAQWPPQLIVGTGGDKLAKEPQAPDRIFDRQIAHALILRNFAYMDEGETLLRPGDVFVQRGTNHSWSVRGNEPCIVAAVLVGANPV